MCNKDKKIKYKILVERTVFVKVNKTQFKQIETKTKVHSTIEGNIVKCFIIIPDSTTL